MTDREKEKEISGLIENIASGRRAIKSIAGVKRDLNKQIAAEKRKIGQAEARLAEIEKTAAPEKAAEAKKAKGK